MGDISEDIAALVDEFSFLDEWEERYRHVISLGEKLPAFPDDARTEANRVRGCVSQVWLIAEPVDDGARIAFQADSDAHIVRGLAAILMRVYSGRTPAEILAVDSEEVLSKLGLDEHLSPQRSNGLRAMVERIRAIAQAAVSGASAG
ncbi:MAG: SufE family protein [Maricaulaceae bacterium]|jgi:cysteine desulfuration protein SufE